MADDFAQQMADAPAMPEKEQKELGKAAAGKMDDEHENFVRHVLQLIDEKKIDPMIPDTLINHIEYEALDQESKAKVDLAKVNMASQLQRIVDFRLSKQTPDSSPQLATMIEHLWQMRERLENHKNVVVF